ncbi:MAG: hypothetical protein ACR2I2_09430 [Bryobacteraceae bacterium]
MEDAKSRILKTFSDYLCNVIDLAVFQERISLAHWNIEKVAPSIAKLVYLAVGKLAEFSRGHRTEESVRQELANAARPFVERAEAQPFGMSKPQDIQVSFDPMVGFPSQGYRGRNFVSIQEVSLHD